MKKNWVIFLIICGVTYGLMMYRQVKDNAQMKKDKEAYELVHADWEARKAAFDASKRADKEEVERLKAARTAAPRDPLAATSPQDAPTSATALASATSIRNLSPEEKLRSLLTVDTADRHTVDTPLAHVVFTEFGGVPVDWGIKQSDYVKNPDGMGDERIIHLIPTDISDLGSREFPFEFTGVTARAFNDTLYTVKTGETADTHWIELTSDPVNGLVARKLFTFHNDSYVVDVAIDFQNGAGDAGEKTRKPLGEDKGFGIGWKGGFKNPAVVNRATGTIDAVVAEDGSIHTKTMKEGAALTEYSTNVHWAGQESKFFTALLIPSPENPARAATVSIQRENLSTEYKDLGAAPPVNVDILLPSVVLGPEDKLQVAFQAYVGPKSLEALKSTEVKLPKENGLSLSTLVFHQMPLGMSFVRPLSLGMLKLMRWLHDLFGIWGLAIICTTIVVRVVIYPLTHWAIKNQARTMFEQQKVKPELDAINKKFKGDPMKRNQAVMKLYQDHNINPLGMFRGCLPMLLQSPILLALYVVFAQSVELRGARFLWINDLSAPDSLFHWSATLPLIGHSFNLLPIIMAMTSFLQMRIMQNPPQDETQAKMQKNMTYMMPIMFTFFLYQLPSGLILYWIVSNSFSIGQSYFTKRLMKAHMAAHQEAEKKKGTISSDSKDKNWKKTGGAVET